MPLPSVTEPAPSDPRVVFAAERTLLAWIRTGVALMGFGFVVARFGLFLRELAAARAGSPPESGRMTLWAGTALVLVGVAVNLLATAEHVRVVRRLRRGELIVPRAVTLGTVLSVVLAAMGLGMAGYLVFVR